eukprot:2485157-Rhodomonas_salina.2
MLPEAKLSKLRPTAPDISQVPRLHSYQTSVPDISTSGTDVLYCPCCAATGQLRYWRCLRYAQHVSTRRTDVRY